MSIIVIISSALLSIPFSTGSIPFFLLHTKMLNLAACCKCLIDREHNSEKVTANLFQNALLIEFQLGKLIVAPLFS